MPTTRVSAARREAGKVAVLLGSALLSVLVGQVTPAGAYSTVRTLSVAADERVLLVLAGAPGPGDGSAANPFPTVQAAVDLAGPGDTVLVGPGVYPGSVRTRRPGTAAAPIRIVGSGAQLVGDGSKRLIEVRHDHIVLDGLYLTGGNILVVIEGASHVSIINSALQGASSECIRVRDGSSANVIAANWIRSCGLRGGPTNGEGVYIGTAPERLYENSTSGPDRSLGNWVVGNNIAVAGECVDIKESADGTNVVDNVCVWSQYENSAGLATRARWTAFRGNVSSHHLGAGIQISGDAATDGISNLVENNVLTGNAGYGLKVVGNRPQTSLCGNDLRWNGRAPTTPAGAGADRRC